MPIYTQEQLNQDIMNKKIEYIVDSPLDIHPREQEYIANREFKEIDNFRIGKLSLDFKESIRPLKKYFLKTYFYLMNNPSKYQLSLEWWGAFDVKDKLFIYSFFKLNQRIYFATYASREYDFLPDYLKDGWLKAFGGIVLSESLTDIGGKMLIGDPYGYWRAFNDYLPRSKRKARECIQSLVQKIPYAFIDLDIKEKAQQQRHAEEGFPNLRIMLDTSLPDEYPEEYDLLLMCYQYDHRVFWVKDDDFINGIYEITEPAAMLDEYFLHVFSQTGQEYTRFDFSPWAKPLLPVE